MATSIADAFDKAPASTERTALITDFNALNTELGTAQAAGAYSTIVLGQLRDMLVDLAETVAANMQEHT